MAGDALVGQLSALQLADSAFPSGRYTLSYGLEAVAADGRFQEGDVAAFLSHLLGDSIRFAVAPSDGVALACAHRAVGPDGTLDCDQVLRADHRLTAVKLAKEGRDASIRTGRALLATSLAFNGAPAVRSWAERVRDRRTPGNHAIVLGLVTATIGVPRLTAVTGELYSFSSSWAAAAVRLGLVDHRGAQRLLHHVRPTSAAAARAAVEGDVEDISSCAPFLDVMSMRHEQADLRLFAS